MPLADVLEIIVFLVSSPRSLVASALQLPNNVFSSAIGIVIVGASDDIKTLIRDCSSSYGKYASVAGKLMYKEQILFSACT